MRIAVVQFGSLKNPAKNLEKAEKFIKEQSGKSELIVFPELFMGDSMAETLLPKFQKIAKDNNIDIVPGSMPSKGSEGTTNSSFYIDNEGSILSKYDKCSPWKTEKIVVGEGPEPFDTRFGKTAMIICWDLANPIVSSALAAQKPELIICPSMWWEGADAEAGRSFAGDFVDSLCISRAYESHAIIVYANHAGRIHLKDFTDSSVGRSQITAPFSGRIAEASGNDEQIVVAEFDKRAVERARRYFG